MDAESHYPSRNLVHSATIVSTTAPNARLEASSCPASCDLDQLCSRGNQAERASHLFNGPEGIARAVDEQRRRSQIGQVSRPKLSGPAWWVQRVGEQQQRIDESRLLSGQHRRLPAAVGMAAEQYPARTIRTRSFNQFAQPLSVPLGIAGPGRSAGPGLAIGQIGAMHTQAALREGLVQGDQQRRILVRACSVGENQRRRHSGQCTTAYRTAGTQRRRLLPLLAKDERLPIRPQQRAGRRNRNLLPHPGLAVQHRNTLHLLCIDRPVGRERSRESVEISPPAPNLLAAQITFNPLSSRTLSMAQQSANPVVRNSQSPTPDDTRRGFSVRVERRAWPVLAEFLSIAPVVAQYKVIRLCSSNGWRPRTP